MAHDLGYRGVQFDLPLTPQHIALLSCRYHAIVPKQSLSSSGSPLDALADAKNLQELGSYLVHFSYITQALLISGYVGNFALLSDMHDLRAHLNNSSSSSSNHTRTLSEVVTSVQNSFESVLASSKRREITSTPTS